MSNFLRVEKPNDKRGLRYSSMNPYLEDAIEERKSVNYALYIEENKGEDPAIDQNVGRQMASSSVPPQEVSTKEYKTITFCRMEDPAIMSTMDSTRMKTKSTREMTKRG